MAKAEQLIQLLKSHMEGDDDRFYSVALQVAANEARRGHSRLAQELKSLVDKAKSRNRHRSNVVALAKPKHELGAFISVSEPKIGLNDLVFSDRLRSAFERIILEYRQQSELLKHGLNSRRKLLLYGPPGTGKTATASALARELRLPLFTIRLDGLITKYMGETASKLRQLFDSMRVARGVYFFDEFDAIGSDRDTPDDVGEIRRVLNSFLMFMEEDDSDSLIVAATNYVAILDFALFRRFDDLIRYELPERKEIRPIVENRLHKFATDIDWLTVENNAYGLSHAEITRACDDAAKMEILKKNGGITTENLIHATRERESSKVSDRKQG